MLLLVLGLILWLVSHLSRRFIPAVAAMPDGPRKGLVTLLSLGAVVLMVIGFRQAEVVPVWNPPAFLTHVNNLLMLLAIFLLELPFSRGVLRTRMRHPMLTAVKTWAVAHLLVNGDLASILLFGTLLAWAVVALVSINRATPGWTPPAAGPVRNDVIYGAIVIVLYLAIGWVHSWLGVNPFG